MIASYVHHSRLREGWRHDSHRPAPAALRPGRLRRGRRPVVHDPGALLHPGARPRAGDGGARHGGRRGGRAGRGRARRRARRPGRPAPAAGRARLVRAAAMGGYLLVGTVPAFLAVTVLFTALADGGTAVRTVLVT